MSSCHLAEFWSVVIVFFLRIIVAFKWQVFIYWIELFYSRLKDEELTLDGVVSNAHLSLFLRIIVVR